MFGRADKEYFRVVNSTANRGCLLTHYLERDSVGNDQWSIDHRNDKVRAAIKREIDCWLPKLVSTRSKLHGDALESMAASMETMVAGRMVIDADNTVVSARPKFIAYLCLLSLDATDTLCEIAIDAFPKDRRIQKIALTLVAHQNAALSLMFPGRQKGSAPTMPYKTQKFGSVEAPSAYASEVLTALPWIKRYGQKKMPHIPGFF
jgi:hypothetical protein